MDQSEVRRLEGLWAGDFGNEYTERNRSIGDGRQSFWHRILSQWAPGNVLEVGCNVGANLKWIASGLPGQQVYGVDINEEALQQLRMSLPLVNALWSPARRLPFRDGWFDLVFTMGVLIHQPRAALPVVMAELVRCSRRFVLCAEYYSAELVEVPYRGQQGALFKQDYGRMYLDLFPELVLREQGFLSRAEGWDDLTYWLFEITAR